MSHPAHPNRFWLKNFEWDNAAQYALVHLLMLLEPDRVKRSHLVHAARAQGNGLVALWLIDQIMIYAPKIAENREAASRIVGKK